MKIAIIDDGIGKDAVSVNVERYCVENGKIAESDEDGLSSISHGSLCAKIIEKYTDPSKISIVDIKILDKNDQGDVKDFIAALEFCYEHKIKLINMSCGFDSSAEAIEISRICSKLYFAGTVMVAASNNGGNLTYPACLSTVLSVEQIIFKNDNYIRRYLISDIYTYGEHVLKQGEKEFYSLESNSMSCAYACSLVANELLKNNELNIIDLNSRLVVLPYIGIYDFPDLPNVVLLADDEQYRKDLCFDYIKYPSNKYSKHINLVIIPSKSINKKTIMECLSNLENNIDKVIWCGKVIPHFLKVFCKKNSIRYWDENVDKSEFFALQVDVPVIQFFGDEHLILKAVSELTSIFQKNMYNVLAVSDMKRAYLYGFKEAYFESSINLYLEHFQPDLMILYMKKITANIEGIIKINCAQAGFEINSEKIPNEKALYDYIVDVCGE